MRERKNAQPRQEAPPPPARERKEQRPYLSKERFALIAEASRRRDDKALAKRVDAIRSELSPKDPRAHASYDAIVERWRKAEAARDALGEVACARLWTEKERTAIVNDDVAMNGGQRGRVGAMLMDEALLERDKQIAAKLPPIQARYVEKTSAADIAGDDRDALAVREADAKTLATRHRIDPVTADRVLEKWQTWTASALAENKAGRGDRALQEREHLAFATLYLNLARAPAEAPRKQVAEKQQPVKTATAPTTPASPAQTRAGPTQPAQDPEERRRTAALSHLRRLHPDQRAEILSAATDLARGGPSARDDARRELPTALQKLAEQQSKENAIHALTLAAIASTATPREMTFNVPLDDPSRTAALARVQEVFPPGTEGLSLARDAFADAAVRHVIEDTDASREAAFKLALGVDELERRYAADERWEAVGKDLLADIERGAS